MARRTKLEKKAKKKERKLKTMKVFGPSTDPDRKTTDTSRNSFYRTKSKIKLLNIYNEKPDYDKMSEQKTKPSRIQPDRKWFGNVRTIDQKDLEKYRIDLAEKKSDPYNMLLKSKKLPLSLLKEPATTTSYNLLDVEKFSDTFGPKSKRKKPKINSSCLEILVDQAEQKLTSYESEKDGNLSKEIEFGQKNTNKDKVLDAGQSKRIWEELYKVLDSSDVICIILDARNPEGTRCKHVEDHITKNLPHKHIIFILNKCDLIPTSVTTKWVKHLSKSHPTIAYHASITNPFGKASLIQILRQFDNFHKDKKNISVGFIGYPNVGKSSVINSLKKSKVCKATPVSGETKVWQYVNLTKRIYLIDCPGIVYDTENIDEGDVVLKGVVRAERLQDPGFYIDYIIKQVSKETLNKVYGIKEEWEDAEDFLTVLARSSGRLLKGGESDTQTTAKIVLQDWQRGKIPFFHLPPEVE